MLIVVISMNIQNDLAQPFFETTLKTARLGEHVEETKGPFLTETKGPFGERKVNVILYPLDD